MTRKARILELCDELHFGAPERAELAPLLESEEYTEEVAARLAEEIQHLEALLTRMRPILALIMKRESLKAQMKVRQCAMHGG